MCDRRQLTHLPPIVRLDHDLTILGIDPDVVIVAVRCAQGRESFSTVDRLEEPFGAGVNGIGISWISTESCVVKGR